MDPNLWISWMAMEEMQNEFPHLWMGEYNGPANKLIYFPGASIVRFHRVPRKRKNHKKRCSVSYSMFRVCLAYCSRCGSTFKNVDGCPKCGTDKYLTSNNQ